MKFLSFQYSSQLSALLVLISSVQSLSHVRHFATPWTAARQASLSITYSRSSLKLTSNELVMPPSHLILPASESFSMSQLLAWGGQSTGVSASAPFLPKNTEDWAWCSLCQQHQGCFDFIWKLPGGSKGEETPMGDVGDHLQGLYKCANKYVEGSLHNIIYTRI